MIRSLPLALGLALTHRANAAAMPDPPAANTPADTSQHAAPYECPTIAQITQSLEVIREHLEKIVPLRISDARSDRRGAASSRPWTLEDETKKEFSLSGYPMGVIDSGMLAAAAATKDKAFSDFVARQFQFFSDHLPTPPTGPEDPSRRRPLMNLVDPSSLDSCGALGAAMVQARLAGVGPDMKGVIDRWADYVRNRQYRLPDGTLARQRPYPQSVWLDDAYMSVPLLAEMGKMTGDWAYYDDAARQMKLFYAHLFIPSAGLFTHACHMGSADDQPKYYWGRANGWFIVALVTLLEDLPPNYPDRPELMRILKAHAMGLATCQSGSGLWWQMLDRPDSYLETSCTAMFTYALAKAVNHGWLDAGTYAPVAIAGWNGLSTRITVDGRVEGTCIGTSYGADYFYYYHRPATDDPHGYGPTLLAGAEMIRLLQNPHCQITGGGKQPIMVLER